MNKTLHVVEVLGPGERLWAWIRARLAPAPKPEMVPRYLDTYEKGRLVHRRFVGLAPYYKTGVVEHKKAMEHALLNGVSI